MEGVIDTGSPISVLSEEVLPRGVRLTKTSNGHFEGINGSKLKIRGTAEMLVKFDRVDEAINMKFYVVPKGTMSSVCLLGRDMINHEDLVVNIGKTVTIVHKKRGNILMIDVSDNIRDHGVEVDVCEKIEMDAPSRCHKLSVVDEEIQSMRSELEVKESKTYEVKDAFKDALVYRKLTEKVELAKLTDGIENWDKIQGEVEVATNNAMNKTTGESPSMLLFGVRQRRRVEDKIQNYLQQNHERADLLTTREQAAHRMENMQESSKAYYDKKRKKAAKYGVGDRIRIENVDTTISVNKKLVPKFKGPYRVEAVLEHDRYVVSDLEGFQLGHTPFTGVVDPSRMKHWSK
uniref:Peptidase A2 domain-containing protein n=1 Tax=Xenopsylla cheopis TaxID=163159 RepID=A0A6M2DT27_XENCH